MDVTSSSTMKSLSFLATATATHHITKPNPSSSLPPWPPLSPNFLNIHALKPNNRTTPLLSRAHCFAKHNANINSETDEDKNPTFEPNPSTKSQGQSLPTSENHASSSSSSSPSSATLLHSRGLVLDLGNIANSWDSADIGSPVVKRFLSDDEERWYMWYHGSSRKNPNSDSIGLAVSSNGIHWERGEGPVKSSNDAGLVISCSKDWWAFDTMSVRPCEVVIMSSNKVRASSAVYWLYYTGYSSEKVRYLNDDSLEFTVNNPERFCTDGTSNTEKIEIFQSLPGLAISQDGRHWARIEGEHHSGALFDVGAENDWDSLFISSPQVVFHRNGDLRMYYHSFDREKGEFCLGMARSRDGIKWVKLGKIMGGRRGCFDECGLVNAHVVKNKRDGKYLMVYEGVGRGGERSIGYAVSSDGLKDWRRPEEEAILRRSDGEGWDSDGVGSPCLVQMEGEASEWRLYYRGIGSGGRTGIGLAISQGSELGSFEKWTGFHI